MKPMSLLILAAAAVCAGAIPSSFRQQPANPTVFPRGGVMLWSGSASNIPIGWALCNGTNGTPDLRHRFAGAAGGPLGAGFQGAGLVPGQLPLPTSAVQTTIGTPVFGGNGQFVGGANGPGVGPWGVQPINNGNGVSSTAVATDSVTVGSISGGTGNAAFLQQYYALAYIMRL